jgi:hypothetical protein
VFTPVADSQGLLTPAPVRYTRFKPSNIVAPDASQSYFVTPTPAQCAAGGGEDWNNGTSNFYVPRAGIYTVSLPAFNVTNNITAITAQVTAYSTSGAIDSKSVLIGTLVDNAAVWQARDISVYVPEGGRIRLALFTYQVPGNILFDVSAVGGIFTIYLNEVAVPYIVANKGALVSSDAYGGVKIADDGTMGVNGGYSTVEVDTGETWVNGKPIYKRSFAVTPGVSLAPGAAVDLGSAAGITTVLRHELVIDGTSVQMLKLNAYDNTYTVTNLGGVATGGATSPWWFTVWGCK